MKDFGHKFASDRIYALLAECERILKPCPRKAVYEHANRLVEEEGYVLDVALTIAMKTAGLSNVIHWVNHNK